MRLKDISDKVRVGFGKIKGLLKIAMKSPSPKIMDW